MKFDFFAKIEFPQNERAMQPIETVKTFRQGCTHGFMALGLFPPEMCSQCYEGAMDNLKSHGFNHQEARSLLVGRPTPIPTKAVNHKGKTP